MLITFKSKAAADVVMYKEHASRILELFGKSPDQGIITAEETAGALKKLEAEISDSKLHHPAEDMRHDVNIHHRETEEDSEHERGNTVSFATRAFPLLEMLRAAHKDKQFIVWGV
jgi:predicted metalloendopeptidase